MNMKTTNIIVIVIIVAAIAGITIFSSMSANKPGVYDEFAECLGEKEAKFYGTFWCPYCQKQKKMFDKSAKLLPYIECSTADGKSQLPICTEAGIDGYPLWEFADGSRLGGVIEFEVLAEKTGCELPVGI